MKSLFRMSAVTAAIALSISATAAESPPSPFVRENLIAWCIVPFDAAQRGPEARAAMLEKLGIPRLAYDWRDKDIPTFGDEIDALRRHDIQLQAFWCPSSLQPEQDKNIATILDVLKQKDAETELWVSMDNGALMALEPAERVEAAARAIGWIATRAEDLGCSVGLYNHGGWFGDPDNQIAIIELVSNRNVGIVYNFHHAHEEIDEFESLFARMKPHLYAVNLNGMKQEGPKILPLGEGDRELDMMKVIGRSGYRGPVGILDHRSELDAEKSLRQNLEGLKNLLEKMGDEAALATYKGN